MTTSASPFLAKHLPTLEKGIFLFNEGKFWECHEELEHHWLESRGKGIRYVYWAVLQVATSLLHYHNGRMEGAKGQIAKAWEKFSRCESMHIETDVLEENLDWSKLKTLVRFVAEDPKTQRFEKLAKFTFKDPSSWKGNT